MKKELSLSDFAGTNIEKSFQNDLQTGTHPLIAEILKKGGEGSRGGHVIGHTRSGKPIYEHQRDGAKHISSKFDSAEKFARAVHDGESEDGGIKIPEKIQDKYVAHRRKIARQEGLDQDNETDEQEASNLAMDHYEGIWEKYNK